MDREREAAAGSDASEFFDAGDTLLPPEPPDAAASATAVENSAIDHGSISPAESSVSHASPASLSSLPAPSSLRNRRRRADSSTGARERRRELFLATLKSKDSSAAVSTSTLSSDDRIPDPPISSATSTAVDLEQPNFLDSVTGFVIKSVFFQLNLLYNFAAFPFRLSHLAFSILIDPLGAITSAGSSGMSAISHSWKGLSEKAGAVLLDRLGNHDGVGQAAVRVALGVFWAGYISTVLLGLLVMAFIGARIFMQKVMTEPIQIIQNLNFDYTKPRPVALVPVQSCRDVIQNGPSNDIAGSLATGRTVPRNHKLSLFISLTLPESYYNRNIGVFQVRAEFLSADGEVLWSTTQPCMLRFKSSHMHLIETFLRSAFLLSGYSSESQVIKLEMRGFTGGLKPPITCIRVFLEQRAEFKPGAGIPEIYAALLKLESDLPFPERIVWSWRRTIFVWISTGLFVLETAVVLLCCRPVILPRIRHSR